MRVLYVNHTAEVSGAERSLMALLEGLPADVHAQLAAPSGRLTRELAAAGLPTDLIRGTAGSLRLHPRHTPVALAEMAVAARQVRRAARAHDAQLVHANSIRSGIVVSLARPDAPIVVHVRDCLPRGRVSDATMRLIGGRAKVVLANSRYTADTVLAAAPGARVEVLHNPVDLARWDPSRIDRARARAALGPAGERALLLGVVAQLSPWKGQDTAIEALRLLCRQGLDAHLLLVGSAKFVASATRFDNRAYVQRLHEQVRRAGLSDRVSWLGERDDVPAIVRALDVLLLPSQEEPFGRALIEAMAMGVPVLATAVGGPPEIIRHGREGLLAQPGVPAEWAASVRTIAQTPGLAGEMGAAGRLRARDFAVERHVQALLDVYRRALA